MLLSKKSEMFAPNLWPSYYSKAKGISVFDLDGNEYLDFSTMSVGACSLGYGNESVDEAVIRAVRDGVMSSLNSPAEVELAERLIEMHPWAQMARFARSGGEANAIAVRIARASTGRDKIAICGYHGWHDWYLAANLSNGDRLESHILPGLNPLGVPRGLSGTVEPFEYNDLSGLEEMLASGDFAAVKMEVSRSFGPKDGFLHGVRELCDRFGTLLIFDECTSGFRETFGGLHLKFGVDPDLAMFGKALGNGYAITAVIGTKRVMKIVESTFISSTFWTERIGPVAALASLREMERLHSWETISNHGARLKAFWKDAFSKSGIDVTISGLDAIPSFQIIHPRGNELKTFITQELLAKGILGSNVSFASVSHDERSLAQYKEVFVEILNFVEGNMLSDWDSQFLKHEAAQEGFTRIN